MLWILPPLSDSWIMKIIWLYIALNRTPKIDCYWVRAVPKTCSFLGPKKAPTHVGSSSSPSRVAPYL